jgi:hypothetical protein
VFAPWHFIKEALAAAARLPGVFAVVVLAAALLGVLTPMAAAGGAVKRASPPVVIVTLPPAEKAAGSAVKRASPPIVIAALPPAEKAAGGAVKSASPPAMIAALPPAEEPASGAVEPAPPPAAIVALPPAKEPAGGAVEPAPPPAAIMALLPARQPTSGAVESASPPMVTITLPPAAKAAGGAVEPASPPVVIVTLPPARQPAGDAARRASPPAAIVVLPPARQPAGGAVESASPPAMIAALPSAEEPAGGALEPAPPPAAIGEPEPWPLEIRPPATRTRPDGPVDNATPPQEETPQEETPREEKPREEKLGAIEVRKPSVIRPTGEPPPGFEQLTEPQITEIDVFFGGRSVGSAIATFTELSIEFENPPAITDLIPGVLDKPKVTAALSGSLETNSDRLCGITRTADCGLLSPAIAGVILDADHFRVDVFVNSELLARGVSPIEKFLPPSAAKFSGIESIQAALSGVNGSNNQFSISSQSVISFGEARARSLSFYSKDAGVTFETFNAGLDKWGYLFQGGVLKSRGTRLIGEEDIFGFSAATNLLTRLDLEVAFGARLEIFLPQRAQVDLFKDERLINSQFYEAGNQVIDTSALPDGAYEVRLRIREVGGVERTETRFFVKTAEIPPHDQPIYFLEAGLRRRDGDPSNIPRYNKDPVVRAGTIHRVNDFAGIDLGLLAGTNQQFVELGAFAIGSWFKTRGSLLGTTDSDYGISFDGTGRLGDFDWSLSLRRIWAGHVRDDIDTRNSFDPINLASRQINFTLTYLIDDATLGFRGNFLKSGRTTTESYGPFLRWPFYREGGFTLEFDAESSQSNNDLTTLGFLRMTFSGDHFTSIANAGLKSIRPKEIKTTDSGTQDSGTQGGPDGLYTVGDASLTWNDLDVLPSDELYVTLRGTKDVESKTAGIDTDYKTNEGRATLAIERATEGDITEDRYSGNLLFSLASEGSSLFLGGREQFLSGVIVEIEGSAEDASFDILVDGSQQGRVPAGSAVPIFLRPYELYSIQIVPRGRSFVEFDNRPRKVPLYPGNIVRLTWSVNEVFVLFARAVRPDGTPVSTARIRGAAGFAATEADGSFQIEVAQGKTLHIEPLEGEPCDIELPELKPENGIIVLDDLVCR